ncbi:MAG: heme-binding protein [Pseudomonadota bacterium]
MLWFLAAAAGGVLVVAFAATRSHGIETPSYAVVKQDGAVELRDYPALTLAEVTAAGGRRRAIQRGFRVLAGYLFGRNARRERIAMTAPVLQARADGGSWVVRFIMPEALSRGALPAPTHGEVRLTSRPAMRAAAIRFSGVASEPQLSAQRERLMAWLSAHGWRAEGTWEYAFYDDPMTPGFMRRNEVLVPVTRQSG